MDKASICQFTMFSTASVMKLEVHSQDMDQMEEIFCIFFFRICSLHEKGCRICVPTGTDIMALCIAKFSREIMLGEKKYMSIFLLTFNTNTFHLVIFLNYQFS